MIEMLIRLCSCHVQADLCNFYVKVGFLLTMKVGNM